MSEIHETTTYVPPTNDDWWIARLLAVKAAWAADQERLRVAEARLVEVEAERDARIDPDIAHQRGLELLAMLARAERAEDRLVEVEQALRGERRDECIRAAVTAFAVDAVHRTTGEAMAAVVDAVLAVLDKGEPDGVG